MLKRYEDIKGTPFERVDLSLGGALDLLAEFSELAQVYDAKIAGGFIRDQIHGRPVKDIDLFIHCKDPRTILEIMEIRGYENWCMGEGKEYASNSLKINSVYECIKGVEDLVVNLVFTEGPQDLMRFPCNLSRVSYCVDQGFTAQPSALSNKVYFNTPHKPKDVDYLHRITLKYPVGPYEYLFTRNAKPEEHCEAAYQPEGLLNKWYMTSMGHFSLISQAEAWLRLMLIYGHTTSRSLASKKEWTSFRSQLQDLLSRGELTRSYVQQDVIALLCTLLEAITSETPLPQSALTKAEGYVINRSTIRTSEITSQGYTVPESATDGRLTMRSQPSLQMTASQYLDSIQTIQDAHREAGLLR